MINKNQYYQIHGNGSTREEMERRWFLFEQEQARMLQSPTALGGRACVDTPSYETITDTVWIYPPAEVEYVLATTATPFNRVGNTLYFSNLTDMGTVYDEIYLRTSVTQPIGNVGYSLGVGTILLDQVDEFYFRLDTEELIVTWRLTKQLTVQSELPVGGDSPVGTIGYLTVDENWPIISRPEYYDPVLVVSGPVICV